MYTTASLRVTSGAPDILRALGKLGGGLRRRALSAHDVLTPPQQQPATFYVPSPTATVRIPPSPSPTRHSSMSAVRRRCSSPNVYRKPSPKARDRTPLISPDEESQDVVDLGYMSDKRSNGHGSERRSRRPYSEHVENVSGYRNGFSRLPAETQKIWEEPYRLPRVQMRNDRQEPIHQLRNGMAELKVSAAPRGARPPPVPPSNGQQVKRPPLPEPRDPHTFEVILFINK